jgi:hypothetical protein
VKEASSHIERDILIQPMSICHTDLHAIPMGRHHRPLVAWYGDLDFMPHIKAFVARGAVNAVVSYGSRPTAYPTAKPWRNRWKAWCGRLTRRRCADGRERLTPPRLKSVMKSRAWVWRDKRRPNRLD